MTAAFLVRWPLSLTACSINLSSIAKFVAMGESLHTTFLQRNRSEANKTVLLNVSPHEILANYFSFAELAPQTTSH